MMLTSATMGPVDQLMRAVEGLRETCDALRKSIARDQANIAADAQALVNHEAMIADYLAVIEKLCP